MTSLRPIAAAAVCALAAFGAHAGVAIEGSGAGPDTLSRTTAERMVVEPQGIGHVQLIPYYSTNAGNQTLFSITNEDVVNGKVVKVRFRSMGNGDTVYDFTLFLGPGDTWTANVNQGRDGKARLVTNDTSCSAPSIAALNGTSFGIGELPPVNAQFTESARDAWTREGFIEVINTADLSPTLNSTAKAGQANPLFVATKQVNGTAPCSAAELGVLLNEVANEADAVAKGLDTPSGSLSAYALIVNTQDAFLSWTVEPTTLRAMTGQGKRARGRLVVSPQTADAVDVGRARALTADALLTQGRLTARQYHFPDLSTPYLAATTAATPLAQATHTGESMAVTQFSNQYSTLAAISSMTDFVVTEPVKRYFVGVDYAAADADRLVIPAANGFYGMPNTVVFQNRGCYEYRDGVGFRAFDRAGKKIVIDGTGGAVITGPLIRRVVFCGGTSVYGVNSGPGSTVLKSAPQYRVYPFTGYQEGWLQFDAPGAGSGMPIIGLAVTAALGAPSNGVSTNYGWTVKHKGTPFER